MAVTPRTAQVQISPDLGELVEVLQIVRRHFGAFVDELAERQERADLERRHVAHMADLGLTPGGQPLDHHA